MRNVRAGERGGSLVKVVDMHLTQICMVSHLVDAAASGPILDDAGLLNGVKQAQELRRLAIIAAATTTAATADMAMATTAAACEHRMLNWRCSKSARSERRCCASVMGR